MPFLLNAGGAIISSSYPFYFGFVVVLGFVVDWLTFLAGGGFGISLTYSSYSPSKTYLPFSLS